MQASENIGTKTPAQVNNRKRLNRSILIYTVSFIATLAFGLGFFQIEKGNIVFPSAVIISLLTLFMLFMYYLISLPFHGLLCTS